MQTMPDPSSTAPVTGQGMGHSSPTADDALREAVSALLDGECTALQAAEVTRAYAGSVDVQVAWSRYQWLGEALRADHGATAGPGSREFVGGVMARIAQEAATAPVAVAAPRAAAANEALFRWKMVAGVASLCAVAALAWQLVVAPAPGAAPQLAQAPAAVPVVTEHGVVLRDPQLEELMAAHRQYGGVSALQMPAGFLRNATYEAPQR